MDEKLEVGDVVTVKGQEIRMTVDGWHGAQDRNIDTIWFNADNALCRGQFHRDSLVKFVP